MKVVLFQVRFFISEDDKASEEANIGGARGGKGEKEGKTGKHATFGRPKKASGTCTVQRDNVGL